MCLQAITLPDHRFQSYLRSVDFIQRYIFPGGCLPSLGTIAAAVSRVTDLRWLHCEDFGTHYAATINHWRKNFWERIDQVRALGFDHQFIRTWEYYLCYCLAGFAERQIGVAQLVLARPQARLEPILSA
jgi:cyclopropane-fatty-acyl-phospholipid synthase